jgi:serine phosphatase RsbU (regulator of sigma subunit)
VDGTLDRLVATGTVLGLFEDWDCMVCERQLHPGDTLVLYTDGITEACNEADEEYGEQRLVEVLERCRELDSHALLGAIVDEVRRFSPLEQQDDITVLVARCRGN